MRSSTSKMKPDISVIVCHHKGDFIQKFVESCKKQITVTFEIIVITSDDKLALTGIPGCIVQNGAQFPAEKRNQGARIARGKYLAFFDDDVEIKFDCLLQFLAAMKCLKDCGMVYGKLHKMDEPGRFDEAGGFLTWTGFIWSRAGQNVIDEGQHDMVQCILAGKSASCMIEKKLFRYLGGFDEDFGILGEETDLSWRVWLAGKRVYFIPTAFGYHAFNTKFKPAKEYYTSSRVHYNGCRNYLVMLLKNLGRGTLWILPLHLLIWFFAGFAMLITLKLRQGFNIWMGIGHVMIPTNLKHILEKRRKVQNKRVVSDRDLKSFIFARTPRGYYAQRFLRYLSIGLHG